MKSSISIFTISMVLFIGWIILGATPDVRIERTCQPVIWLKNLAESASMLAGSNGGRATVDKYMSDVDYGCRYMVWRLIYGSEYESLQKEKQVGQPEVSSGKNEESDGIIM